MCIICECGDTGADFLLKFAQARRDIDMATEAMLRCSKATDDPAAAKRYDRAHKAMVRLVKDWNRIEHERESCPEQS